MARWLVAYLASGLVVAALDAVWLTLTNARLYRAALGAILTPGFRPVPAVLFYLLYLAGVVIFAVAPAIRDGRWTTAAMMGALFGLFCYATYDLTNQATLIVWATRITVLDIAWGTALTAAGATAGYLASALVKRGG
ncbi:MAG: DUF2177 family protein [Caulobacteraceae bacterium]|nr:DUF2177 family protein [Caulobacteraceae bacterium]